jgi:hypothetical protein
MGPRGLEAVAAIAGWDGLAGLARYGIRISIFPNGFLINAEVDRKLGKIFRDLRKI